MIRNIAAIISATTMSKTLNRGFSRKLFALANAKKMKNVASSIFVNARRNPRSDDRALTDVDLIELPVSISGILFAPVR